MENKDKKISFRCTEKERKQIKERAEKCGLKESQYILSILLGQDKITVVDSSRELLQVLTKIETEYNYIKINNPDIDLNGLRKVVNELWSILN